MRPWTTLAGAAVLGLVGALCAHAWRSGDAAVTERAQVPARAPSRNRTPPQISFTRLPVRFEPNLGQCDEEALFLHRGRGGLLFLTRDGNVTVLGSRAFRMRLDGAEDGLVVEGEESQAGRSNYFKGNDPDAWVRDVPHVGRVRYRDVYAGIDLVYHGSNGGLEYDFEVAPGADASRIAMRFEGVDDLRIDGSGDLVLGVDGATVRHLRPIAYQPTETGRAPVDGRFVLDGDDRVRFAVGAHDGDRMLIIDPTVEFATYVGGSGAESGLSLAVDDAGSVYVGGSTNSSDFPLAGALSGTLQGGSDAFVTKLNAAGDAIVYSTYFGGTGTESAKALATDDLGNVVLCGDTTSDDLPTKSAAQASRAAGADGFAAKLDAAGSTLVYSTFMGGAGTEYVYDVAVDASGAAYVAGMTFSIDFPVTGSALRTVYGGGVTDVFLVRVPAAGGPFAYATYVGGNGRDENPHLVVDASGVAYLALDTQSTDIPTTTGAHQETIADTQDAWYGRIDASGSTILTATYYGGGDFEYSYGLARDGFGNVWLAGRSRSTDLATPNGFLTTPPATTSAYLAKLTEDGATLLTASYFGGADGVGVGGVRTDSRGDVYVCGQTLGGSVGNDFPVVDPLPVGASGTSYIMKVRADGSAIDYATRFGGGDEGLIQRHQLIEVDAAGNAYMVGTTGSVDLPTTTGAAQTTLGGGNDAFIVKVSDELSGPPPVGDDAIHTSKGVFKINHAKHARDVDADSFVLSGYLNPRGTSSLDGATLTLSVNGTALAPPQVLDSRGGASSARRAAPKFRFRVSAKNGKYSLKVSKTDLRPLLALADVTETGTTPITIEIDVSGAGLATPTVKGDLEFAYATRAGKASRGTYVFARNTAVSGACRSLRTKANELAAGGHKVTSRIALAMPGGVPLEISGNVTLTVGGAAPVVVPAASLRVRGAGSTSSYSYSAAQGAVAGLTKLSYSNRRRTLSFATSASSGTGIPATGQGAATATDVAITVDVDTPSGTLSFTTTLELLRSSGGSRRWSR